MADFFEIDFLGVETAKSGDAITLRYSVNGVTSIHVVDGGYLDTGDQIVEHIKKYYGGAKHIDHVVLTHPDQDHANGLRKVLEHFTVGRLWINRPWLYAEELIQRFETYNSVDALRKKLRSTYGATAALEDLAQERRIPISAPMQGAAIGAFSVLAPTRARYLDLIVESEKTPQAVKEGLIASAMGGLAKAITLAASFLKAAWGEEYFPPGGTSSENEMSVVQYGMITGKRILLTGDVGRDGLTEAADYCPSVGLTLPGEFLAFQVPHHGGRHNVNTELLDRWLGERLSSLPSSTTWNAICSSAKADEDHPRKSVVRAMLHRGGHFSATEGRTIHVGNGISRGWNALPQTPYPGEQEE